MSGTLHLLVVEDNPDDAALLVREIERGGRTVASRVVQSEQELRSALSEGTWDAVIADYALPSFDAPGALQVAKELEFDGPFIVVSGTVDEEMTVAVMRAGAHDYVMKSNLRRLLPALERELRDAKLREDRREARRRSDATEALFRRVVRQLPGFVWSVDHDLRVLLSLGATRFAATLPHDELAGRTVRELESGVPLFDAAQHERALAGEHVSYEASWAGSDYLVQVEPLLDDEGQVAGCIAVALDVTEQRASEQALRESEGRFRALIENSLDVTTILGADARVRYISPTVGRVLGYAPDALLGTKAYGFIHPDDVASLQEAFAISARAGGATETGELRLRHRDGSWRLCEASVLNLLADPAVRGLVVTTRDVTERRELEDRLSQAARLEAVGQLAGGVAHDFNNVLLVIRGYSTVLRSELEDAQQVADVDEIVRAADRAAQLTRQLLAFGRRQVMRPQLLNVAEVIVDLESLLRRTIREDIELLLRLPDELPAVRSDPSQIEQMLLNLVVNARDAMPGGGTITIEVGEAELTHEDEHTAPAIPAGHYVTLCVGDTGCGIPEDVLPHVFEPFFTTKVEGLGTGLGLSTVYGIVAQNGGGIAVRTREGEGTAVTVFLPAAAGGIVGAELPHDEGEALAGGSETVLLVEDEEPVRELVRRVLHEAGYRVLVAARPSEALELADDAAGIDLLLTDVVMPEMSGYDLAELIRRRRPSLRLLFMSGYSEVVPETAGELLRKPFSPDELLNALRAAFRAAPPMAVA